ncbi:hypothetical protein II906_10570 [bacterium]|nr:hypothetical protein [bacterium]
MSVNNVSFKGYDAAPLKSLYMQGLINKNHADVFGELKTVCEKEGINLLLHTNQGFSEKFDGKYQQRIPWAQDFKTFVNINGKTQILTAPFFDESEKDEKFLAELGYEKTFDSGFLIGGNSYIGKKPNGEKWVLLGEDETELRNFRAYGIRYMPQFVAGNYGVKMDNIYTISQPAYHIDEAIRPVGYPYVLVNDDQMARQNAAEQGKKIASETDKYYDNFYSNKSKYVKSDQTVKELKEKGFIPIRIGGVYASGVNYMNAIVNQHPDGTISYITNSAKGSKFEGLDEVFERDLRAKVPNIRDVYFISGKTDNKSSGSNPIMNFLSKVHGGIHCLTLEEPDFQAWA